MRSTTGGQHSFARIPQAKIERSAFDRSCGLKTTFDAGWLIPVICDEALPGDTMALQMHNVTRLSTPLAPLMDNMIMDSFFFSVPIRLIWKNWDKFNGAQDDPGDSTSFIIPTSDTGLLGASEQSLSDYIGIPTETFDLEYSNLWHRAYNLIWNEWFRDENLQDSVLTPTGDGPDLSTDFILLRRGKRHDYFTSALPWPQKGPAVGLPLGTSAPVVGIGDLEPTWAVDSDVVKIGSQGGGTGVKLDISVSNNKNLEWIDTKLETDLSNAVGATINEVRQAIQIQKLYERDARGGTRYTEIIRAHFGVTSPDARLQRPEFLGGGTQTINITPVPQTSRSEGGSAQGDLAAYGVSHGSGHGFNKSFTEHCIIIGMISVRADLNYQQGLERMFSRSTRWDYFWPALAHIGEQAVLNKEIYAQGSGDFVADAATFGYQERFAEYRYKPSRTSGLMRSQALNSLDLWHLAQDFSSLPVLDATFIEDNPPIDRVVSVPTEPAFKMDAFFKIKHVRPMPTFGVPGQMDRF